MKSLMDLRNRLIDEPLRNNYILYRAVMITNINQELEYYFMSQ